MKAEPSFGKILLSLTYLVLMAFALRVAFNAEPVRVGAASPQNQRKSVEESFTIKPQVRVTKLKVGAREQQFKEEFDDADDWPRKLSFEIENISSSPIVYLQLNLNFPETRSSGNLMSYPIKLGVRPGYTDPSNLPLRLVPGDRIEIPVRDHYDKLERFLKTRHTMNQIRKAQVEIGFIIFENGLAWAGDFLRPDPNKPGSYVPVAPTPPN